MSRRCRCQNARMKRWSSRSQERICRSPSKRSRSVARSERKSPAARNAARRILNAGAGSCTAPLASANRLLHVLDLLAQLFADHLGVEEHACHLGVAALRSQCVELAEQLLRQEVETLADGA